MPTLAPVSRLSLKTILFPTDFSPASHAALPFAQSLAKIYGSTILFAHAIAPEPRLQVVMDRVPEQDDVVWLDARHKLDVFAQDGSLGSTSTKTLLERGDLALVIPVHIVPFHSAG